MLDKTDLSFLRILSGTFGAVSLFLPWWVVDTGGRILLFYPMNFGSNIGDYSLRGVPQMPYYILTDISAILAITVALMVLGCFAAFFTGFTPGTKARTMAFVGGVSFCLAPIIFAVGFNFLFSGANNIFWGSMGDVYSSSISLGFVMAFVAAVPAFLSLGNLKRIKLFLLMWMVLSAFFMIVIAFAYRGFWGQYGSSPSLEALVIGSFLNSLLVTSICTFAFGIYTLLRKHQMDISE